MDLAAVDPNEVAAPLLPLAQMTLALLVWLFVASRILRLKPVLTFQPRRSVPWQWFHVVAAFGLYEVLQLLMYAGVSWWTAGAMLDIVSDSVQPSVASAVLAANAVADLLAMTIIILVLRQDVRATSADLGFSRRNVVHDVALGMLGFIGVFPVLGGIITLLSQYSTQKHPLEVALRKHHTPTLFFWATLVAVLAAPIIEEFLFRVLLQGWLEKKFLPAADMAAPADTEDAFAPGIAEAERAPGPPAGTWRRAPPIIISALIFAAFHIGQGTAPVPLFVFALLLGYLYQRTHRLLPCVVAHMSLNMLTMLALFQDLPW